MLIYIVTCNSLYTLDPYSSYCKLSQVYMYIDCHALATAGCVMLTCIYMVYVDCMDTTCT